MENRSIEELRNGFDAFYQEEPIVISSDVNQDVWEGEVKDKRTGLLRYSEDNPLKKIYIKRWADILDQNECSYKNLKQSLDLDVDQNDGAQYIKENFSDIINMDKIQ